jgi:hypothetical protein
MRPVASTPLPGRTLMANMNGWDVALLVVAGYVAVTALVRLMLRRRNEMVGEFRQRMKTEKKRKEAEAREQELRERRSRAA